MRWVTAALLAIRVLAPVSTEAAINEETVITFSAPECVTPGEEATIEVQLDYVADFETVIYAYYQTGYDWDIVEGYPPETPETIPGAWETNEPVEHIFDWEFFREDGR
ncbi:hypothetical protein KDL45_03680, partial [bacterium]|nr:hypothetical protein [bacterium]